MKTINEILSELIQLTSVQTIEKNNDEITVILITPLASNNCAEIINILDGYDWYCVERPKDRDMYDRTRSFILVKANVDLDEFKFMMAKPIRVNRQ